ncbi:hypothetical protein EDD15DRAFT_1199685 [Pisolithus albus]|nr:hypothetical protein EDD15DRAFT_1199685 [Pisolithus albus]
MIRRSKDIPGFVYTTVRNQVCYILPVFPLRVLKIFRCILLVYSSKLIPKSSLHDLPLKRYSMFCPHHLQLNQVRCILPIFPLCILKLCGFILLVYSSKQILNLSQHDPPFERYSRFCARRFAELGTLYLARLPTAHLETSQEYTTHL